MSFFGVLRALAAVASCQAASLDMAVAFVAPVVAKQEARIG